MRTILGTRISQKMGIFALWALFPILTSAQVPGSPEELRKRFDDALDKIVQEHAEKIADLNKHYVVALVKLEQKMQKEGKLTELVKVKNERELFEKSGAMGPDDLDEIKDLRSRMEVAKEPIDEKKSDDIVKLTTSYLKLLEPLQLRLTKAGRIDEALAVKSETERVTPFLNPENAMGTLSVGRANTLPAGLAAIAPIPSFSPPLVSDDIFERDKWPEKLTLPVANFRLREKRDIGRGSGYELVLQPGTTFKGLEDNTAWNVGNYVTVAKGVTFDSFGLYGNLGAKLYLQDCTLKDMDIGKGGGWFGGRPMTRWQFLNCTITGSFVKRWESSHIGLQMVNSHVERVEFVPIKYHKDDKPGAFALSDWAMIRDTHFRKCVIPASVLSLMENCTFDDCRFIDDPEPPVFEVAVQRTIYIQNCNWLIKDLPTNLTIDQKPLSAR